jgi:hypothetical protein
LWVVTSLPRSEQDRQRLAAAIDSEVDLVVSPPRDLPIASPSVRGGAKRPRSPFSVPWPRADGPAPHSNRPTRSIRPAGRHRTRSPRRGSPARSRQRSTAPCGPTRPTVVPDPDLDAFLRDHAGAAPQPLHGDYYRGNTLTVDGSITALLDWDEAFVGSVAAELAVAAWEWGGCLDADDRAYHRKQQAAFHELRPA